MTLFRSRKLTIKGDGFGVKNEVNSQYGLNFHKKQREIGVRDSDNKQKSDPVGGFKIDYWNGLIHV